MTKFGNSQIFANNATISANGTTIVFESNYAGANAPPIEQTAIWAVQADGSRLRLLSFGTALATNPSISAGGETIAFVESGQVYVSRFGGTPIAVTSFRYSAAQSPVVSDDGQTISFLLGPAGSSGAGAVYTINSDGTNPQPVYAPRAISPRGVVSAAGFSLPPSPGGLLTIYGINFSSDTVSNAARFPLPQTLAGASVLAGGTQLPLVSLSPWQINAQLRQQTPLTNLDFQVTFADGTTTASESAGVVAAAPDLFIVSVVSGLITEYQATAYHAGTSVLADDNHPAHAGEILELYGTGLGVTDPLVAAGQPSPSNPVAHTRLTAAVMIGDVAAKVTFAGLTPGLAGVYQVNIVVPNGLAPGRYPVIIQGTNGNQGGQGGIAVQANVQHSPGS